MSKPKRFALIVGTATMSEAFGVSPERHEEIVHDGLELIKKNALAFFRRGHEEMDKMYSGLTEDQLRDSGGMEKFFEDAQTTLRTVLEGEGIVDPSTSNNLNMLFNTFTDVPEIYIAHTFSNTALRKIVEKIEQGVEKEMMADKMGLGDFIESLTSLFGGLGGVGIMMGRGEREPHTKPAPDIFEKIQAAMDRSMAMVTDEERADSGCDCPDCEAARQRVEQSKNQPSKESAATVEDLLQPQEGPKKRGRAAKAKA